MTPDQIAEARRMAARVEADEIAKRRRQRMIRIESVDEVEKGFANAIHDA